MINVDITTTWTIIETPGGQMLVCRFIKYQLGALKKTESPLEVVLTGRDMLKVGKGRLVNWEAYCSPYQQTTWPGHIHLHRQEKIKKIYN